jgi:hypothetical protein
MKVTNIKLFKNVFTELSKICDEIQFQIHENELQSAFLNRARTVFCKCTIKCLETTSEEEGNSFAMDIHEFGNVLKNIKNTGELSLQLKEAYVDITYASGKSKKKYRIGLLNEDDVESREPPKLEYDMFIVSSDFIKESLNDIKLVSTVSCVFKTEDDYFMISLKEPTMMLMEYENSIQVGAELTEQQSTYTMELLNLFLNLKEINQEINIGFQTDYPLKLLITNDDATVEGIVAPRLGE